MSDEPPQSPPKPRRVRAIAIAIAAAAIAVAALVLLGAAYVASGRAVVAALDYAVERTGGRLEYDGATGSVLNGLVRGLPR